MGLRQRLENLARSHQTYIVPTGHGVVFLLGIIVMILAGATYSNNLIYLLAFFLFASFVVSMVQTHHNIAKVKIEVLSSEDGPVGGWITVDFKIFHDQKIYRQNLKLILPAQSWSEKAESDWPYLSPKGQARVSLSMKALLRGRHRLPRIRIETTFPLGLFRAWKLMPLEHEVFVYPALMGTRNIAQCRMELGAQRGSSARALRGEEDDFYEHKSYQLGESSRRVDWKLFARKRIKMVKSFEGQQDTFYRFIYTEGLGPDTETRLSQLATWIDEARAKKWIFELWLPHKKIEKSSGPQQARLSLRELAQFSEKSST